MYLVIPERSNIEFDDPSFHTWQIVDDRDGFVEETGLSREAADSRCDALNSTCEDCGAPDADWVLDRLSGEKVVLCEKCDITRYVNS